MRWGAILLAAILSSIVTVAAYDHMSLLAYKLREPYFKYPVKNGPRITIRNDGRGDGHYGAKRRNGRLHEGVDIAAPVGTPVYASKSGIAFRGNVPTGYGKYVMIYHPDGFQTMYGHLKDWNVISATKVRQGDIIGFAGKTGNASNKAIEPHVHFEIRKAGASQDPQNLMEKHPKMEGP